MRWSQRNCRNAACHGQPEITYACACARSSSAKHLLTRQMAVLFMSWHYSSSDCTGGILAASLDTQVVKIKIGIPGQDYYLHTYLHSNWGFLCHDISGDLHACHIAYEVAHNFSLRQQTDIGWVLDTRAALYPVIQVLDCHAHLHAQAHESLLSSWRQYATGMLICFSLPSVS